MAAAALSAESPLAGTLLLFIEAWKCFCLFLPRFIFSLGAIVTKATISTILQGRKLGKRTGSAKRANSN
jgi:hypothetical protein